MIDPHVHLRDWELKHKETLEHGLHVAELAGLDAVFDMPNTSPPITIRELVELRLKDAAKVNSPVFYGLYIGLAPNSEQIREAVEAYKDFFPKPTDRVGVIGLKMFAGKSVGDLTVTSEDEQRLVYQTLKQEGYRGVLAVHCEKESEMKSKLWNPEKPITHCYARPPKAESESVKDQINFSDDVRFQGHLHIVHVSDVKSVHLVEEARRLGKRISCGVTPHHCVLDERAMEQPNGIIYKVNPPLRSVASRLAMLDFLREGKIDWIETDHAPHTFRDKIEKYMSGFPGLPFYPHFINYLKERGFSEHTIHDLTHRNIERTFRVQIEPLGKKPELDLDREYEVDVYKPIREK